MSRLKIAGAIGMALAVLLNPFLLKALVPALQPALMSFENQLIASVFVLVLFGVSLLLFVKHKVIAKRWKKNKHEYVARFLLLSVTTIISLLILDFAFNIIIPKQVVDDPVLGWDLPPDLIRTSTVRDFDNRTYEVTIRTGKYGFRRWGDPNTAKAKVLILGDSFTETQYPNEEVYYAVLERELDVELFVKGIGGWGTLQQYIAMDRTIDEIDPDIVILQMTANDVINNDHYLESNEFRHNNRHERPYWEDGQIVVRDPLHWSPPDVVKRFRVVNYALLKLRNFFFYLEYLQGETIDGEIATQGEDHQAVQRAVETTDALVGMMKARAGDRPFYAFLVDGMPGDLSINRSFHEIMQRHGITVIPGVQDAVVAHAANETVYNADGYHWNARGNEIAGEVIAAAIADEVRRR